ncbi:MAG: hypothetical protein MK052_02455 [Alphaproteobacteria bacterium]|nr:hypothetical protein [Alphaproteobacteria bacterium]
MAPDTPSLIVGNVRVTQDFLVDITKLRPPYDHVPAQQEAQVSSKLENNWKLHMISDVSRTGYDGALFSTEIEGKPHYVIYHQGTNDFKDLPSIARLANCKSPQQLDEAVTFTQQAQELVEKKHPGEDAPLIQSGYSLGGALAILASNEDQPVITFEAPVTKKMLKAAGRDTEAMGENVLEVLSPHANFINSNDAHVGEVLAAGKKFWTLQPDLEQPRNMASFEDFVGMTAETHRIQNLSRGLDSLKTLEAKPFDETGRPEKAWGAITQYADDFVNKEQNHEPEREERRFARVTALADRFNIDDFIVNTGAQILDKFASSLSRRYAENDKSLINVPKPKTNLHVEQVLDPELVELQQGEGSQKAPAPTLAQTPEKLTPPAANLATASFTEMVKAQKTSNHTTHIG